MIQLNVTGKLNLPTVLLDSSLNVHTSDERYLQTTYTGTNIYNLSDPNEHKLAAFI